LKIYTLKEVAEELKLSDRTISTLIRRQKINIIMIGSSIRITEAELSRLKEKGTNA